MPPIPLPRGSARSAAVINEEIRALWTRADGGLSPTDEQRYQELLVEWADAVRDELVEAA